MSRTIQAVDLFAGAGGTSTGLALACKELGRKVELTAINHWPEAVETHTANHPWAKHICQDVRTVNPEEVVPGLHADILVASPECIFYSRAAGGRPKLNQYRATAWDILPWLERIRVDNLLVENVPEFQDWAPLDSKGHPIKSRKGEIYQAWLHAIRVHGYNVDARVLNAADYGAATSRARLFVVAKKGDAPIDWPIPSRNKKGVGKKKWRPAREIIDWTAKGESIFTRKKPLSETTLRRIVAGLKRFGGKDLQPFLVLMEHGGGLRDLDDPLPTITTAKGGSMALVDPFVLSQASGGAPRSVNEPLPTIPGGGAHALVESCLVPYHGERKGQKTRAHSVDNPVPVIATSHTLGLAEAFILPVRGFFGQNTPKSVDVPLGTITQRGGGSLVEPYIFQYNKSSDMKSVEEPLNTVTTKDRFGLVEPCIIRFNGSENAKSEDSKRAWRNSGQSVTEPLATVTGRPRFGLAEPYLLHFNGTDAGHIKDSSRSVDEPLDTIVSSSNHFALVQPEVSGRYLDIRFRMLQPRELSAAMGFPSEYKFTGNKTEVIKMIGNAVVVDVAKALVKSLLTPLSKKGRLV